MALFDDTQTARPNATERDLFGDDPMPGDREMFKPSAAMRPALAARVDELRDAGFNHQELVQRHRAFVTLVHDTGLPAHVAEQIYGWDTDRALRAASDDDTPAVDGEGWFEESRRQTRALYGNERAEKYLGMVEHFLAAHPALRDKLEGTGHRHDPDLVQQLIDHVRHLHE